MYTRHSKTATREYFLWRNIIQRCENPKNPSYPYYGGRGIQLSDEFQDFRVFYEHFCSLEGYNDWLDKKPVSLDRKDNDRGYERDNLRFCSKSTQCENRGIVKNNTSGYRCVHYHKSSEKWDVSYKTNKQRVYIGRFNTAKEGAIAYNKYIKENNIDRPLNKIEE